MARLPTSFSVAEPPITKTRVPGTNPGKRILYRNDDREGDLTRAKPAPMTPFEIIETDELPPKAKKALAELA